MSRLPIEFGDPDAETQALQDYTSRLPVELPQPQPGYTHTYQPGWDAQLVQEEADKANPLVFAPAIREGLTSAGQLISGEKQLASPSEMLSHVVGPNRLQMWPEQLIRSGFTLPHDVMTGEVPVWDGEHTSPELIQRTQDLAGMAGGGFAAKPNAVTAMADSAKAGASIAALEHAPVFYSALEHAVQNAKVPKANAEDWLGYLRNQPGVKQEELDWVLHDLPKGAITKGELEQFVNSHKVELKEVNKSSEYTLEEAKKELINLYGSLKGYDTPEAIINEARRIGWKEDSTKYSQWQLPGGNNYREQLLTLPAKNSDRMAAENYSRKLTDKYGNQAKASLQELRKLNDLWGKVNPDNGFKSSHWNEPNVLAHIRTNERAIPSVGNSLHIEEIQSDLHQLGRKQGYIGEKEKLQPKFDAIEKKIIDSGDEAVMSNPELKDALKLSVDKKIITADEARDYQRYSSINAQQQAGVSPIKDAPFKTNWPDLALKRVIRQAAESGKDSISWTPGEAQALRYQNDVRQKLNSVDWHNKQMGKPSKDGSKQILVDTASGGEISLTVSKEGTILGGHNELKGKRLDSILGKDIASQILEKDKGNINAKGYVMNSEPMKAFYDKMLVDKANAIAKKFGGKVEQSNLGKTEYSIEKGLNEWNVVNTQKPYNTVKSFDNAKEAKEFIDRMKNEGQPIHVLRITPQLRDAALNKGFSLFADTGKVGAPLAALTRVEHNPFKLGELEQQHGVSLTPVDYNPFTVDTYHGTPRPFAGTDINPSSKERGTEFYSSNNPQIANEYAAQNWLTMNRRNPVQGNVLPLKIDVSQYHTVDAKGKQWHAVNDQAVWEANQLGKKGVIVKNVFDGSKPSDVYITLDPSTVRSRFAKFDPKLFGESGLLKSAGIPIEINNQNGQDPFIDNTHTVPYGAGASNNGLVVHIDNSIPRFDAHTGDLDLYKPLALHERTEKKLMDAGMPYEYAHKIATEAEKGYVGDRWKEYEKVMDGYLKKTENEKPSNPPSNLYLKPYPHNKQELLEKYGTHSPEDEPSSVGISGKTTAIGAAKAAEWVAFIGARNYPKIAGPMYASWVAQWPLLGHMLKADVRKQLNAGVKPEDIEFKPGTIGDLFGIISKLRSKYGDKADKLEPIDHNPFAEGK